MLTPEEDFPTWNLFLTDYLVENDMYVEMFNDFERLLGYFDENGLLPPPIEQYSEQFILYNANCIIQNVCDLEIPDQDQLTKIIFLLSRIAIHITSLFAKNFENLEISIITLFNHKTSIYNSSYNTQINSRLFLDVIKRFVKNNGLDSLIECIQNTKFRIKNINLNSEQKEGTLENDSNSIQQSKSKEDQNEKNETPEEIEKRKLFLKKLSVLLFLVKQFRNYNKINDEYSANIITECYPSFEMALKSFDISSLRSSDSKILQNILKKEIKFIKELALNENKLTVILDFIIFCLNSEILEKQIMASKIFHFIRDYFPDTFVIKQWASSSQFFSLIILKHKLHENVLAELKSPIKKYLKYAIPNDTELNNLWNLTIHNNHSEREIYVSFLLRVLKLIGEEKSLDFLKKVFESSSLTKNAIDVLQLIAAKNESEKTTELISHFLIQLLKSKKYQKIAFASIKQISKDQHQQSSMQCMLLKYCTNYLQDNIEGNIRPIIEIMQCLIESSYIASKLIDDELIDLIIGLFTTSDKSENYNQDQCSHEKVNLNDGKVFLNNETTASNEENVGITKNNDLEENTEQCSNDLIFSLINTCCVRGCYVLKKRQFDIIWSHIDSHAFSCFCDIMRKCGLSFLDSDISLFEYLDEYDFSKSDLVFVNFVSLFIYYLGKNENVIIESYHIRSNKFPTNFTIDGDNIDGFQYLVQIVTDAIDDTAAKEASTLIIIFASKMQHQSYIADYLMKRFLPILTDEHLELPKHRVCNLLYEFINYEENSSLSLDDFGLKCHKKPKLDKKIRINIFQNLNPQYPQYNPQFNNSNFQYNPNYNNNQYYSQNYNQNFNQPYMHFNQNQGQNIVLYVSPSISINKLCMKAGIKLNYTKDEVSLLYQGKMLDRDWTLKDYDITHNCALTLYNIQHRQFISKLPDSPDILASHLLYKKGLTKLLLDILREFEEPTELVKSVWKLLCILETDEETLAASADPNYSPILLSDSRTPYELVYNLQCVKLSLDDGVIEDTAFITDEIISLLLNDKVCNKGLKEAYTILINANQDQKIFPKTAFLVDHVISKLETIKSQSFIICAIKMLQKLANLNSEETCNQLFSENSRLSKYLLSLDSDTLFMLTRVFQVLSDKPKIFSFFSSFLFEADKTNELFFATYCNVLCNTITSDCDTKSLTTKICDKIKTASYPFLYGYCMVLNEIFIAKTEDIFDNKDIIEVLVDHFVNDSDEKTQETILGILNSILVEIPEMEEKVSNLLLPSFSIDTKQWNFDPRRYDKTSKYTGLKNLGATCYLNSIIQQLFINSVFRDQFKNIKSEENWIISLQKIFAYLQYSKMPFITTKEFCDNYKFIDNQPINTHDQQDGCEFYQSLLDKLPKELSKLFCGKIVNIIESVENNIKTENYESFFYLPLNVKGMNDFDESFGKSQEGSDISYFSEELNQKVEAKTYAKIAEVPEFLVIQLKRFEYDIETWTKYKVNSKFTVPYNINLWPYMSENYRKENSNSQNNNELDYELTGIVVHDGHAEGGHYYSLIKIDDKWFNFNDTLIEEISIEDLENLSSGTNNHSVEYGPSAYILFFSKMHKEIEGQSQKGIETQKTYEKTKHCVNYVNTEENFQSSRYYHEILKENNLYLYNQCVFRKPVLILILKQIRNPNVILSYVLNVGIHSKQNDSIKKLCKKFWHNLSEEDYENSLKLIIEQKENIKDFILNCSNEKILKTFLGVLVKLMNANSIDLTFPLIEYLGDHLNEMIPFWKQIPCMACLIFEFVKIAKMDYTRLIQQITDFLVNLYSIKGNFHKELEVGYLFSILIYLFDDFVDEKCFYSVLALYELIILSNNNNNYSKILTKHHPNTANATKSLNTNLENENKGLENDLNDEYNTNDTVFGHDNNSLSFLLFVECGIRKGLIIWETFADMVTKNNDITASVLVNLISSAKNKEYLVKRLETFQKNEQFYLFLSKVLLIFLVYNETLREQCIKYADITILKLLVDKSSRVRENGENCAHLLFPEVLPLDNYLKPEDLLDYPDNNYIIDSPVGYDEYEKQELVSDEIMPLFNIFIERVAEFTLNLSKSFKDYFMNVQHSNQYFLYFTSLERVISWIYLRSQTRNPKMIEAVWTLFTAIGRSEFQGGCNLYEFIRIFRYSQLRIERLDAKKLDEFVICIFPISFQYDKKLHEELFLNVLLVIDKDLTKFIQFNEFLETLTGFFTSNIRANIMNKIIMKLVDGMKNSSEFFEFLIGYVMKIASNDDNDDEEEEEEEKFNNDDDIEHSAEDIPKKQRMTWQQVCIILFSHEIDETLFLKILRFINDQLSLGIQYTKNYEQIGFIIHQLNNQVMKYFNHHIKNRNQISPNKESDNNTNPDDESHNEIETINIEANGKQIEIFNTLKMIVLNLAQGFTLIHDCMKSFREFIVTICFALNDKELLYNVINTISSLQISSSSAWETLTIHAQLSNDIHTLLYRLKIFLEKCDFNQSHTALSHVKKRLSIDNNFLNHEKEIVDLLPILIFASRKSFEYGLDFLRFCAQKLSENCLLDLFDDFYNVSMKKLKKEICSIWIRSAAVLIEERPDCKEAMLSKAHFDNSVIENWPDSVEDCIYLFL